MSLAWPTTVELGPVDRDAVESWLGLQLPRAYKDQRLLVAFHQDAAFKASTRGRAMT